MNTQNFNQAGGFPLETDTLHAMQEAYAIFNSLGNAVGNYAIISGCEENELGTTVTDGVVHVDGELYPFKGGAITENVRKTTIPTRKIFENGSEPEVLFESYYEFGTSTTSVVWSNFKRPKSLIEVSEAQENKAEQSALDQLQQQMQTMTEVLSVFTSGGTMMFWNKPANQIPVGWQEVTYWRGRMPVGYDPSQEEFDSIGRLGGRKNHSLTEEQLASHTHEWKHYNGRRTDLNDGRDANVYVDLGANTHSKNTVSVDTTPLNNTGEGEAFSILNPYRVVMFIEYVGTTNP